MKPLFEIPPFARGEEIRTTRRDTVHKINDLTGEWGSRSRISCNRKLIVYRLFKGTRAIKNFVVRPLHLLYKREICNYNLAEYIRNTWGFIRRQCHDVTWKRFPGFFEEISPLHNQHKRIGACVKGFQVLFWWLVPTKRPLALSYDTQYLRGYKTHKNSLFIKTTSFTENNLQ